ncbi:MAG: NAD-binding protein [Gammaproteobacteria bacterium]|nr:NAD-binding protein [Gammaproteobacteria bacterium]
MNNVLLLFLRRMRAPLLVLLLVYTVSIGGLVLIPGQDDQGNLWYFDFFHAVYFVSFMGSTIGFGEIPYEFTSPQRAWVLVCMYMTVIAWLYAVGSILALLQNPAFRNAITEQSLASQVKRMSTPFYVVCGYGQTGSLLVRALARRGIRTIVIDNSADNLARLEMENDIHDVPYLVGDASVVRHLLEAGLSSSFCQGVVAVTDNDDVNVKIAISAKLLNKKLRVVCRAGSQEAVANLESFGTDRIVNPFDTFADHLVMSIERPSVNRLHTLLGSLPGNPFPRPINPPRGRWIIVGYGRCGQALERYFREAGMDTTVIEPNADLAPKGAIVGLGLDEKSLKAAGIDSAVGLVAGTDTDANNLSAVVTARRLNPDLFLVARQNFLTNHRVFEAANLDLVMDVNRIIVWRVLPFLSTRWLNGFLRQTRRWPEEIAHRLVKQVEGVSGGSTPECWCITINSELAFGATALIEKGVTLTLGAIERQPWERELHMPAMALLRVRDGKYTTLPDENDPIEIGDSYLFTGQASAARAQRWLLEDEVELRYLATGERIAASSLGRWVTRRFMQSKPS